MRTCQPTGRVSVCAALLTKQCSRGYDKSTAAQKRSTSTMSESSRGPTCGERARRGEHMHAMLGVGRRGEHLHAGVGRRGKGPRSLEGTDHPQPLRPSPKVGLAGVPKRRVGGEARRREHGRTRAQQLENRRVTDTREAIRGNQRSSALENRRVTDTREAIRGNQRSSACNLMALIWQAEAHHLAIIWRAEVH